MRTQFDKQLDTLHVELIKMGSLCEEAISLAAKMLTDMDPSYSDKIHETETEVDRKEREIENICMQLLLRQQPVAKDLRNISAALKMISDMERIGDQAADIAELAPYIVKFSFQSKVHIGDMARATVNMVTDSVEAFVKADLALARRVMSDDDRVDALFDQVKNELLEVIYQREMDARAALDLLMAAKYFERIGDHAVNIAEWVEYSITGIHNGIDPQANLA